MFITQKLILATAALVLCSACDLEEPAEADDVEFRCNPLVTTCNSDGNTSYSGSLRISALDTQGKEHKGVRVLEVTLSGVGALDAFFAQDGELVGRKGTLWYSGTQFQGARFSLKVEGNPIDLVVTQVTTPMGGDPYHLYKFHWDDGTGLKKPVCLPADEDGDIQAVVQGGLDIDPETGDVVSRPFTVYVACMQGAAGKVSLKSKNYGYPPFVFGLAVYERAIRKVRADYCYSGKSFTQPNEKIAVRDNLGVHPAPIVGRIDAVWGPDGALCIGEQLRAGWWYDEIECESGVKPPLCGTEAETAALFAASGTFWTKLP